MINIIIIINNINDVKYMNNNNKTEPHAEVTQSL